MRNIILQAYLDNALPRRGVWSYEEEHAEAHLSNVIDFYQSLLFTRITVQEFSREVWNLADQTPHKARKILHAIDGFIPPEYYEDALALVVSEETTTPPK